MMRLEERAPTTTGEPAAELQPPAVASGSPAPALQAHVRKPALPALTGVRTLLALTILMFHFTPAGLRSEAHPWLSLYPIIDIGYVFVSFFFLISGFILSYNYADRPGPLNRVDFWMARFSRLYPVYVLTLIISIPMLMAEWHARPHGQFWAGAILTPLLLQGVSPHLATFWNTVTWTLSCEVMLYLAFPWLLKMRWPHSTRKLLLMVAGLWLAGMVPHTVYLFTDPDHLGHMATRYDGAFWLDALKYTPLPYVCTFLAGLTLGRLHETMKLEVRGRMIVGIAGFAAAWFVAYHLAARLPYILIHGGLLTPVFACIILGLSGPSTYCLYLLHFNVFVLLHWYGVIEKLHLTRFDPWVSYVFVVLVALAARKWVEHPAQVAIGAWWKARRAAAHSGEAPLIAMKPTPMVKPEVVVAIPVRRGDTLRPSALRVLPVPAKPWQQRGPA